MSDLGDLDASVQALDKTVGRVETSLGVVAVRLGRVVFSAIVAGMVTVTALVLIVVSVADNQDDLQDTVNLLCPVIRILAATDPPRTTPAGIEQQRKIEDVTERPDYPCR